MDFYAISVLSKSWWQVTTIRIFISNLSEPFVTLIYKNYSQFNLWIVNSRKRGIKRLSGDEGLKDILQLLKEQSEKMERLGLALKVIQGGMRYGYKPRSCSNPDRKNACWRCEAAGHVATLKVALEVPDMLRQGEKYVAHVFGGGSCPVFREELRRLRGGKWSSYCSNSEGERTPRTSWCTKRLVTRRPQAWKILIESSTSCKACFHSKDNAEHALFVCVKWVVARETVGQAMGAELTPGIMVSLTLQSERIWMLIESFVTLVMKTREINGRRGKKQWGGPVEMAIWNSQYIQDRNILYII